MGPVFVLARMQENILDELFSMYVAQFLGGVHWELRNIYHHHPESKNKISSEEKSGFIHPYGRYGNTVKTRKTISTIAILWPVKAIFEKRAATVEVDSFLSPGSLQCEHMPRLYSYRRKCRKKLLTKSLCKMLTDRLKLFQK